MSLIRTALNGIAFSHFLNICHKILYYEFRIISPFLLKLFCKKTFVNSVNAFPANIKAINPMQKYPHIIESYACIFCFMFLLLF